MGADATDCPPEGDLERLLADDLRGSRRDVVEAHVEVCHSCQGRLEQFVATIRAPAMTPEVSQHTPEFEPAADFLSRLKQIPPPHSECLGYGSASFNIAVPENRRLGQYEILGRLGKGGMGDVFKARHVELGKIVALKLLPADRMDEVAVARFKNEIRAIGKLDHPNIVVAHDAGESGGIHFLAMELVDGIDLGGVVDRHGRLSVADACEAVRQAAVGLQHAYERGLVHRDVKPPNLMLARDGRVRLLDLGLARSFGEATAEKLTMAGTLLGTADYLAPEQWDQPHAADTRADIYSLGCTLYHLLAGRPPFTGGAYKSLPSKMQAHREVRPPAIDAFCPEAPSALVAVLGRMLAKDPAERFATPAEVASALRPFAVGADLRRLLDAEGSLDRKRAASFAAATPAPGAWETGPDKRGGSRHAPARRVLPVALAGLFLLLAAGTMAWPWLQGQFGPAAKPLTVTDLRVMQYRGQGPKATFIGDLRTSPAAVRLNDNVRVLAGLSRPAYFYLIALNPKGSQAGIEQLCQPEGENGKEPEVVRPDRRTEVQYPRGENGFSVDAVGLQAFVLAASTKPLPPFKEWRDKAGGIPWDGLKDGGTWRWHFDGREFTRYPRERGQVVPLNDEPEPLQKVRDFFIKRPEFEAVQIIAFPVVDGRE
jgi:hypothetical protein